MRFELFLVMIFFLSILLICAELLWLYLLADDQEESKAKLNKKEARCRRILEAIICAPTQSAWECEINELVNLVDKDDSYMEILTDIFMESLEKYEEMSEKDKKIIGKIIEKVNPITYYENMIKENDDMVLELYFYNKRVKGTLNITKYGENIKYNDDKYYYNNDILLNDVVFYLYAKEDVYENGKLIYSKDDKVNECTTTDGKCKIENIPLGNYYLKEISSSEGNVLDNTEYNISFSYKDQYTENIVYNLEVKNHLPKGKIVINKYETGTKNGISGTLIEIRNINNEIIYKGYTDKNGKIILDDMLYGKYYVSEVEASTGYRLVQDKIYFEVGDKDVDIDIYNERIKVPNTGISFDIKDIFVIVCFISSLGGILLKYKNKYIVIVGLFVIITSILYFGLKIYNHYNDTKNNDKAVEAVLNKKIDSLDNLKYRYKAVLEIPSIKLKRGILDIDNKYNKAKYNIELIKEKDDIIVLASHNGNNYNSYFGNLKNISLGDTINYYYDGKIYKYIYTDSYDIKKDGYADIYRKKGNKCIVLVTCKDGRNDGQTVFIGYLDEILEY